MNRIYVNGSHYGKLPDLNLSACHNYFFDLKKKRRARRSAQFRVCIACSKFGSVRAARALQGRFIDFYPSASARKFLVSKAWSWLVLPGKKNSLWETELEPFTRSVPFWQGRTVVRGSFSETFLEVSVT